MRLAASAVACCERGTSTRSQLQTSENEARTDDGRAARWLRTSLICASPRHDVIALAAARSLVVLERSTAKDAKPRLQVTAQVSVDVETKVSAGTPSAAKLSFVECASSCDGLQSAYVTALLVLPLASTRRTAANVVDSTVVLVGLSDGGLLVYTERGVLVSAETGECLALARANGAALADVPRARSSRARAAASHRRERQRPVRHGGGGQSRDAHRRRRAPRDARGGQARGECAAPTRRQRQPRSARFRRSHAASARRRQLRRSTRSRRAASSSRASRLRGSCSTRSCSASTGRRCSPAMRARRSTASSASPRRACDCHARRQSPR